MLGSSRSSSLPLWLVDYMDGGGATGVLRAGDVVDGVEGESVRYPQGTPPA